MKKLVALMIALAMMMSTACAFAESNAYTASAQGFGGDVTVTVTITDGHIDEIVAEGLNETQNVGSTAIDQLPGRIVESQSLLADGVSGATFTSNAIKAAVQDCLVQAGLNADDYMIEINKALSDEVVRYDTDVVVVGTGLSGMSAIVSAAMGGAKVIGLEKLAITGGSAKSSLGSIMVAEVPENSNFHVSGEEDTLDAAIERWKGFQANSKRESIYPDYERLSYMLVETMNTCEWMTELGATLTPKTPIAERGMAMLQVDVPEADASKPAGRLLVRMQELAIDNGAQIMVSTPATSLITEGDRVVGVRASSPTGEVEVYAKTVILACGSYANNYDMVFENIPEMYDFFSSGAVGDTGDGIAMVLDVGGAMVEDQWVHPAWPSPTREFYNVNPQAQVFQDSSSPIEEAESSYYRLMVDKDGNRFMNEAAHYTLQVLTMAYNGTNPYWTLYDNLSDTVAAIADSGLQTGSVLKADSIADLAQQAGMDPSVLEATVARYNEMAVKGEDADFGKDANHLIAYGETGPYYLVQMIPAGTDILGGVKTNTEYQVVRADGSVIDGLYAVGSMSNGQYYNQWYFSGSSLVFAATSGRLAGTAAAANQ